MRAGLSGMWGQIYNMNTDKKGDRLAAAVHFGLNVRNFHFNAQQTWYSYTQALPDSATQDMNDFINVSQSSIEWLEKQIQKRSKKENKD